MLFLLFRITAECFILFNKLRKLINIADNSIHGVDPASGYIHVMTHTLRVVALSTPSSGRLLMELWPASVQNFSGSGHLRSERPNWVRRGAHRRGAWTCIIGSRWWWTSTTAQKQSTSPPNNKKTVGHVLLVATFNNSVNQLLLDERLFNLNITIRYDTIR